MLEQRTTVEILERNVSGLNTKTFIDQHGRVEAVIASDGGSTIVAIPLVAISRDDQMGDEEYECLKKCKDIEDIEKRTNCTLKCPTTKKYRVFIA
jgi:hypothetical protein